MLYFAYGSNMSSKQMRSRCPESKIVGVAELVGWSLCYPRYSKMRKGGVAGVRPEAGKTVLGRLYELSYSDILKLDRWEGHYADISDGRYDRMMLPIKGPYDKWCRAAVYVARFQKGYFRPTEDYLNTIILGARQAKLPESYVAEIKRTASFWGSLRILSR